jgi:hypothetical protein
MSTDGVPAAAAITETMRCPADNTPGQAMCILRYAPEWLEGFLCPFFHTCSVAVTALCTHVAPIK